MGLGITGKAGSHLQFPIMYSGVQAVGANEATIDFPY